MISAAIIGAGKYGEVYKEYLAECGAWRIDAFLDDDPSRRDQQVLGVPVIGSTADLAGLRARGITAVFAPIGNNSARLRIIRAARAAGLRTPSFIHESAVVSSTIEPDSGIYVLAGSIIMPHVVLGEGVMISMGAKIAHHTVLDEAVFVSTGVNVGASIHLGAGAFLGIGSTVVTGVRTIGRRAVVGAGAVVLKDVADETTVAGVPARVLSRPTAPEQ